MQDNHSPQPSPLLTPHLLISRQISSPKNTLQDQVSFALNSQNLSPKGQASQNSHTNFTNTHQILTLPESATSLQTPITSYSRKAFLPQNSGELSPYDFQIASSRAQKRPSKQETKSPQGFKSRALKSSRRRNQDFTDLHENHHTQSSSVERIHPRGQNDNAFDLTLGTPVNRVHGAWDEDHSASWSATGRSMISNVNNTQRIGLLRNQSSSRRSNIARQYSGFLAADGSSSPIPLDESRISSIHSPSHAYRENHRSSSRTRARGQMVSLNAARNSSSPSNVRRSSNMPVALNSSVTSSPSYRVSRLSNQQHNSNGFEGSSRRRRAGLSHREVRVAPERTTIRRLSSSVRLGEAPGTGLAYSKMELRIACAMLAVLAVVCFFIKRVVEDGYSPLGAFIGGYCLMIYYAGENILKMFKPVGGEWRKTEHLFNVLDGLAGAILVLCVDMKVKFRFPAVIVGFLPFFGIAILYLVRSTAPKSVKDAKFLTRICLALAVFLFTAKLQGFLKAEWKYSNLVLWTYFGLSGCYAIIIGVIFFVMCILSIVACLCKRDVSFKSLAIKVIGLFWNFAYHGLSLIVIYALVGVTEAFDQEKESEKLKAALTAGLYVCSFLCVYSMIFFSPLSKFVRDLNASGHSVPVSLPRETPSGGQQKKHLLNLDVEKTPGYFMMLSSTYFVPLSANGILARNPEIIEKIKDKIKSYRDTLYQKLQKKSNRIMSLERQEVMKNLRKDKEILDKKLMQMKCNPGDKLGIRKRKRVSSDDFTNRFSVNKQEKSLRIPLPNDNPLDKMFLSDGNIAIEDLAPSKNPSEIKTEAATCYICFDKAPDAVLMDCGHSGICSDCAVNLIKRKNECMECRKPVKIIYKVDLERKFSNIIKGYELGNMIEVDLESHNVH